MSTLYVVATPIGNLSDITLRAIEVLKSVDLVLAEDTRVTKKLLNKFEINTPVKSYHQHSSQAKKLEILKLLQDGNDIALVTDAGTPGISDPGNELIDYLDLKTIPIPGPSALTAALSVCGFDASRFTFIGFMPKRKQTKIFKEIASAKLVYVYFDSPHRVIKNLRRLLKHVDSKRRVCVTRELTKMHETIYRGDIEHVLQLLVQEKNLKGELIVVVEKL